MMPPQKQASLRYKSRPTTLIPFKDDTSLVAFRYDQTAQAEPPIPLPPPRSPLRLRPRGPAARPVSCLSAPIPAPVVILPPASPAPRRPLPPPPGEHPLFRASAETQRQIDVHDPKRDSGHAPTTSSRSCTVHEESEDEDPFQYEKISSIKRSRVIPELVVPPLRIRPPSPTSIYSSDEYTTDEKRLEGHSFLHLTENNSVCSIPLPSPGLSEHNTVSPTSPTTPPPNFPDAFPYITNEPEPAPRKSYSASIFSRRSFSFRSSGSSMKHPQKRLQKKHQPQAVIEDDATPVTPSQQPNTMSPAEPGNNAPLAGHDAAPHEQGDAHHQSASTTAAADDFSDFVHEISFSKRGSIMLGGKRPSRHATNASRDDGTANTESSQPNREPRAFPLAPSALPRSQADGAAPSIVVEAAEPRLSQASARVAPSSPMADAPSTPKSSQHPPSIRVISVDVERESQKVRSLYEPGEGLRWEDGGRHSSFGERLEPTVEVPSDVDENDASSQSLDPSPNRKSKPSDQLGTPTQPPGTHGSAAHTVSPPDESVRRAYELAGGIEDWEDVQVEDVDRYGFIAPRRPVTPSSAPPAFSDSPVQYSPRKHRNVLVRKDGSQLSGYLGTKRGPSRKVSARSLHTEASELSATSRHSTRSALRNATNLLPHNRDRRWMDEAGDMLAQQPGLTSIGEEVAAGQLAAEYKQKEMERMEKWRKMAKVIKPGKDGEGMVFDFDTKNPKVIERTWKGIPDRWRAAAWYSFLSSSAKQSKKDYASDDELITKFHLLQEESSSDDVQIDLDVPRTISQHIMFRRRYRGGQRLLFRVLHALSLYFPKTGYVQGMASLAATLLSYYDEEHSFIMLVRMWELRGLNRLYQPEFVELMEALSDFEKYWLAEKDVAKSLKELSIDPTAYGTRWYLTLFHLSIPFSSQLRVWDIFMLLGESPPEPLDPQTTSGKAVAQPVSSRGLEILHATSTAIILALGEHIVDAEFENGMKALTSFVPVKDDDLLMRVVRAEYKHHHNKTKKA